MMASASPIESAKRRRRSRNDERSKAMSFSPPAVLSAGRAPARLRLGESRTAVDQRQRPRAPPAFLVRGRLVDVERGGIQHDAVVLEGAAHRDEAARDVLAHALGITGQRISPAAAAASLEADDVAALEHEAIT